MTQTWTLKQFAEGGQLDVIDDLVATYRERLEEYGATSAGVEGELLRYEHALLVAMRDGLLRVAATIEADPAVLWRQ